MNQVHFSFAWPEDIDVGLPSLVHGVGSELPYCNPSKDEFASLVLVEILIIPISLALGPFSAMYCPIFFSGYSNKFGECCRRWQFGGKSLTDVSDDPGKECDVSRSITIVGDHITFWRM